MPSPRAARSRDYTATALEFDPTGAHEGAYSRARRARVTAYPGPAPARTRTRDGYAIAPRNGIPVRFRAVTDTLGCGCVRRFLPAVMDWDLITPCGEHHA